MLRRDLDSESICPGISRRPGRQHTTDYVQHLREQDTTPDHTCGQDSLCHRIGPSDCRPKGKVYQGIPRPVQTKGCYFLTFMNFRKRNAISFTIKPYGSSFLFLLEDVLTPGFNRIYVLSLCYLSFSKRPSSKIRVLDSLMLGLFYATIQHPRLQVVRAKETHGTKYARTLYNLIMPKTKR